MNHPNDSVWLNIGSPRLRVAHENGTVPVAPTPPDHRVVHKGTHRGVTYKIFEDFQERGSFALLIEGGEFNGGQGWHQEGFASVADAEESAKTTIDAHPQYYGVASAPYREDRVKKPRIRSPLRKGTTVYHGTASDDHFTMPTGPAWVSNAPEVAKWFAERFLDDDGRGGSARPRVLSYIMKASPKLAIVESDEDWQNLMAWATDGETSVDINELAEMLCQKGVDGWHIPHNYPEGSDTLLCEPEKFLTYVDVETLRAPMRAEEHRRVEDDRRSAAYKVWDRRRERDEAVTVNLDPSLLPLWQRIGVGFKGDPHERLAAFMQYVEEHPDEEIEAWQDDADQKTDALIRKRMAGAPIAMARPIPLDKSKIDDATRYVLFTIATELGRRSDQDVPLGTLQLPKYVARVGVLALEGMPNVRRHRVEAPVVFVLSYVSEAAEQVLSGGAGVLPSGRHAIIVNLNGRYTPKQLGRTAKFAAEGRGPSTLIFEEMRTLILHEMTHVLDIERETTETTRTVPADMDRTEYYNRKNEVKAYLQEVVDQVLAEAPALAETWAGQDLVEQSLRNSETWVQLEPYWTEESQKYVRKAVFRALSDADYAMHLKGTGVHRRGIADEATRYFHGSASDLPVGTVLRGDYGDGFAWRSRAPASRLLEAHRPPTQISRTSAIFMTGNSRTIVKSGGMYDHVYEVTPEGPVAGPFDGGWHAEISRVWLSQGGEMDADLSQDPKLAKMADAYWAGEKCRGKLCGGVWEYLTPAARIVRRVKMKAAAS